MGSNKNKPAGDDPNIDEVDNCKKRKSGRQRSRLRVKNEQLESYSFVEHEYYKKLKQSEQNNIAMLESRFKEMNEELVPLRFRIMLSEVDEKIRAIAIQKMDHLYTLCPSSGDYHKILHWIESICKIPFNIYKELPVKALATSTSTIGANSSPEVREFIKGIRRTMDSNVYGHTKAKDQIIRLLAQWISNPLSKGLVIGIQGAMGTGKTTLIKDAICKVLNLPFAFIPLGGASDGSFLVGHSYTYEGSSWGKIVDVLMKTNCMNPVIFFDELDKVSTTYHGDEIINVLIHLTDASQNEQFNDKYFSNLDFDMSRSLLIFSYNSEEKINPILKDRMVCIKTEGYTLADKVTIAQKHIVPSLLNEFRFVPGHIVFSEDILKQIVSRVDEEQGVRNFKRALHEVVSNVNLIRLTEEVSETEAQVPIVITEKDVKKFVTSSNSGKASALFHMYT